MTTVWPADGGASATPAAEAAPPAPRGRRMLLIPALIVVLAVITRVWSIIVSGGFTGYLHNDEGAYFGAAHALANGVMPYKDFLLLHPPGSAILYSPFALLSPIISEEGSFILVRVAVVLLGAVNALLVFHIGLRTMGRTAAIVGGVGWAVFFPVILVERTTMLEPLVNVAILWSLFLLDPKKMTTKRGFIAGAVLGVGMAVKVWAVFPVVAIFLYWLFVNRKQAFAYIVGAAAAATVICLPFFLMAPQMMFHYVIEDQASRPGGPLEISDRLGKILNPLADPIKNDWYTWAWVVIALAVVLVLIFAPQARLYAVLLLVHVGVLLWVSQFFAAYPAFAAVPLLLTVGAFAQLIANALGKAPLPIMAPLAGICVAIGVFCGAAVVTSVVVPYRYPLPVPEMQNAVKGSKCLTSDSATGIIMTNQFHTNVENNCPVVVDFIGYGFDNNPEGIPRSQDPEFLQHSITYLEAGDHIAIIRQAGDNAGASFWNQLGGRPIVYSGPNVTIYGPR